MNDITSFLLIAITSIGIGIAIGSLVSNLMNSRQNPGRKEDRTAAGSNEILRVYRDLKSGGIVLELKGKKFRQPQELAASERSFLEKQLAGLALWVKPGKNAGAAAPQASSPKGPDRPVTGPLEQRLGSVQRNETIIAPATTEDNLKPNYNPLDVFARALRPDAPHASTPASSIAAQIDEILQEKLAGLPDEKRAIRLMELPGKGMVVMVGLDHYDGVDAVPDPEVQNLIRECVREWEQGLGRQE